MKKMTKEVPFGKAIARVTVSASNESLKADGVEVGCTKVNVSTTVEIIMDGKVVESGPFAVALEYNNVNAATYKRAKLDTAKKYSKVGDRAIAHGAEAAAEINAAIEEMKSALEVELQGESEAQKSEKNEIIRAESIVAAAELVGAENLMTEVEMADWRIGYNNLYNEGAEGYIPDKVSREDYRWATNILSKSSRR